METIFKIGSTTDYSDQACAALQLLCNVALTAKGCRLLDCKSQRLLEMLATHDAYMLRQILSILINLSCDATSLELILQAVVRICGLSSNFRSLTAFWKHSSSPSHLRFSHSFLCRR